MSVLLCSIINYYCCLAVFIEELGYRSELFLACCIPDLKLYELSFNLHYESPKLHSDSNLVITLEYILS